MRRFFLLLLLVAPLQLWSARGQSLVEPEIDGVIETGEWSSAEVHIYRLNNGKDLSFSIIYTTEDVFFLAVLEHNEDNDEIILDIDVPHDYFGIEFDNNKDGAIMGTLDNPDDMIIVDYDFPGAVDLFSHTFKVFEDTEHQGFSNTEGKSGSREGKIIWEIRKDRFPTDVNGHDITIGHGISYKIMIAFWDDQPSGSAAAFINLPENNDLFLTLQTPGDPILLEEPATNNNMEIMVIIFATIIISIIVMKKGTGSVLPKFLK